MRKLTGLFIKLLLVIVTIQVVVCEVSAQNTTKNSVRKYYKLKNKAEIYIIDSVHRKALKCYKRAFKYKTPNGRDQYNALLLSILLNDSSYARTLFNDFTKNGLILTEFLKISFFKRNMNNPALKWAIRDYDSIAQIAKHSEKLAYVHILDSLYAADQFQREEKVKDSTRASEVSTQDLEHVKFLENEIAIKGYPCYQTTGIFEKAQHHLPYASNTTFLILWHTRHLTDQLNQVLLDAVYKGQLDPEEYATIIEVQNEGNIYNVILAKDTTSKNIATINENRKKIFLSSIRDYRKKLEYGKGQSADFYTVFIWQDVINSMKNFTEWNN